MIQQTNTQASKAREGHPILWAFEPGVEDKSTFEKVRDVLQVWKASDQKITPITVLTPFDLGWPLRLQPSMKKKLKDQSIAKIDGFLKRQGGIHTETVQVVTSDSTSLRKMAALLSRAAKKAKAEILIVGSGAGQRSELTGLGSFSETLISLSPAPVMVVGTNAQMSEPISRIFFPTDLSPESKKVFQKVIRFAQNWDAEIILYHHFDLQMGPVMAGPYGVGIDTEWLNAYWDQQKKDKEGLGHQWVRLAKKESVRCIFVADYEMGSLRDRMMAAVEQVKAHLIFVGIKRGPLNQVIFGSLIRQLFAKAPCPVVVLHGKSPR